MVFTPEPPPTHEPCGNGHKRPIDGTCSICNALDAARAATTDDKND